MPKKLPHPARGAQLRERAEAHLRVHLTTRQPQAEDTQSLLNTRRLFHELQVHEVELELQNSELEKSRNQLEATLENYTDLYEFAPVGYFTFAVDGAIQLINLTGARLLGMTRNRLVGQSFALLVSAESRPVFRSYLKRVFASGSKQSCEITLLVAGGPPRVVAMEAERSLDINNCRAVVVDITERKRAEQQVRVSEVRYRRLFEAARDGVLLLDPGTRKITDANPFMTTLLGYPYDQLIGKELFEIGLLKDEVASQEMFRKLKRKHHVRYEDLPLESQGGRHQEVEVVANLYEENDHPIIQCNIRDISERKQMEEMLRRNEALFAAILEQAPVGVYVVDNQLRLQKLNPKARPVFRAIQPLIGRDLLEILQGIWPDRLAHRIVGHFQETLKSGQPYYAPDFTERRRDTGVTESYDWQIQRLTLPGGDHGVACFFSDITERKRAEATQRRLAVLASSNQKLEREIVRRRSVESSLKKSELHQRQLLTQSRQLEEQLRQLSRQVLRAQEEERLRISRELHDVIAQTLTAINLQLASLKKESFLNAKDLDRKIESTQRMVEKSVEIVHRFARELRPAVLDDLGLIPALHSYMKEFTALTGVRTGLTAFAAVDRLDSARRTILYRVVQEALTNVFKHAQASQVKVDIKKLPDCICMTIADDGRSFDVPALMRHRGTQGLGLLGMRERLEMVGGHFEIESAAGLGTTIMAQIPHDDGGRMRGKSSRKMPGAKRITL